MFSIAEKKMLNEFSFVAGSAFKDKFLISSEVYYDIFLYEINKRAFNTTIITLSDIISAPSAGDISIP